MRRVAVLSKVCVIALLFAGPSAAVEDKEGYQPTVLITGANRGLGLELAHQLDQAGWRVIATARNPDKAQDLHTLAAGQDDFVIEQLDVTRKDHIQALTESYAGQPIDMLLLNAARGPEADTVMALLKGQNFDVAGNFFATNAIGPMRITQAFMPNVRSSQRKLIVAVSSDSGSLEASAPAPILYHYRASKAAMNMYFHTLSYETGKRGVTVVMLHPGIVATNPGTARIKSAMPTEDSVRQMLEVIESITPADNGRFIDYRGEAMPW